MLACRVCICAESSAAPLQVLLQEHLPNGKVWHQHQDGLQDSRSDSSGASSSDLLEHVDKASGFTPLIAAIYYHKKAAVELVSCLTHVQAQTCTWAWSHALVANNLAAIPAAI